MKFSLFLFFLSSLYCNEFRIITTEHSPKVGMFAAANQVLGQLYLFDTAGIPRISGLAIEFDKYGLYYDPSYGPNWWTYYFEPIYLGTKENAEIVHPTKTQYLEAWKYRRYMSRAIAAQLIKKYIHIKPHIQEKIDVYMRQFFLDKYIIGVHYRGTDKIKEAPRIAYEIVFEEIEKHILHGKPYSIFIGTDEMDFLDQAKMRYSNRVLAIEAHRSNYGSLGVHFENKNNKLLHDGN